MRKPTMAILLTLILCSQALAQPQARKFDAPGAPPFTVLEAGKNPPLDVNGNFVIGPNYRKETGVSSISRALGLAVER